MYRRKFFVFFGLLCVLIFALLACGESTNTGTTVTANSASNTTSSEAATPAAPKHFKVGQAVKVGDVWQMTVNSVKTSAGSDFLKPKAGNTYLVVDISLKNLSTQEQNISSALNFTLQDTDGTKYNTTITDSSSGQVDGKVEAGSPLRGQLTFEVPAKEHSYTLNFAPDIMASGQAVWDLHI